MRKLTTEEYKQRLHDNNPNVELLGEYINCSTYIMFHCKKHNIDFSNHPARVLNGVGCPCCSSENLKKSKTKTHEWYLNELKTRKIDIIPLEKYIEVKTPILHKCLLHNVEWKVSPDNILHGHGCFKCGSEKITIKSKKTNEEYLNELKENDISIYPLEEYMGAEINILHKCSICGYEWSVKPANILFGRKCPKCSNRARRSPDQYIQEVQEKNQNIEVLENYISANTPILHKCKKHNHIWKATPSWILKGSGCIFCGREKVSKQIKKTNEQYIKELKELNPTIIALEEYELSKTKILFKCLQCNHEWKALPGNLIRGHGCPNCKKSLGEETISQWLKKHNIEYEPQKKFSDCKDILYLSFDFYLPKTNQCIEYDGEQHFRAVDYFGGKESLEYTQRHDQMKNLYCKTHDISLLRIPYYADIDEELTKFLLN